ncbi:MAG: EF-P lysine aminoacylase EpmA [Planctomycetota bacterium]
MTPPTTCVADQIRRRAATLRHLRSLFDAQGFCEVQPNCLASDCILDTHIDPIRIAVSELGLAASQNDVRSSSPDDYWYLQTSPESAMKQMLAEGAPSIYAITPVFRRAESGPLHRIEFTMLEWYELGGNADSAIALLNDLSKQFFACEAELITYQELFQSLTAIDPLHATYDDLMTLVNKIDRNLAASLNDDRDGLLDVILSQCIQPRLSNRRSLVVTRYPISQAALAKQCHDDPECADRFEWFVNGIELANGYDELTDADELERRFETVSQQRANGGRFDLPRRPQIISAMRRGLPACSGVALGVDRLQMCIEGKSSIANAIT